MRKEDGSNYWQELQSCKRAVNHQESAKAVVCEQEQPLDSNREAT